MIKIQNKNLTKKNIFITFEAGSTHSGLSSALKLIDIASEAKADSIKFQIFRDKNFIMDEKLDIKFQILQKNNLFKNKREKLNKIFKRRSLNDEEWKKLKKYADKKKILFFATVGSIDDLNFVKKLGCPSIKISSSDLTFNQLLIEAAKTKKNIQIDTGNASFNEIQKAVNLIKKYKNKNIILHYCPPGYPTDKKKINFEFINKLKKLNCGVGYSDHFIGTLTNYAAMCYGVVLIEKTITLNKYTPQIEHCFSIEKKEAINFVRHVKDLKKILNNKKMTFTKNVQFRRGIYLNKFKNKGSIIKEQDIVFSRPLRGLSANEFDKIKKKKLNKNKKFKEYLTIKDFD